MQQTTLAKVVGNPMGYAYISLDDDVARAAAEADPAGFVGDLPPRVIMDEVQRVLQNARHLPTFATASDQLRQRN